MRNGHGWIAIGAVVFCGWVASARAGAREIPSSPFQARLAGPVLRSDRGNHSFRGVVVSVGATSRPFDLQFSNDGDAPLTGVTIAAHGDFVVTKTTCAAVLQPTLPGAAGCRVSVAFKPTERGLRTGDLTVAADGIQPVVVPLDAGSPIAFGTLPVNFAETRWINLSSPTPVSGSVTGPFTMTLQAQYDYDSINGVHFDTTSSATSADFLGVRADSPVVGPATGTVTLSDGATYDLTATVAAIKPAFSPTSVNFQSVPYQSAGLFPVVFTNLTSSPLIIRSIQTTAPFSQTSDCGTVLAVGASCTVDVIFKPTAQGEADGMLTIMTGTSEMTVPLTGWSYNTSAFVSMYPASVAENITGPGGPVQQTITFKNLSTSRTATIAPAVGYGTGECSAQMTTNCIALTSDQCSGVTLAPQASCEFQAQYRYTLPASVSELDGPPYVYSLVFKVSMSGRGDIYTFHMTVDEPTTNSDGVLEVYPSSLLFPALSIGQASDEQVVTLVNLYTKPVVVSVNESPDFNIDLGCLVLAPGARCPLHVRFTPIEGGELYSFVGVNATALDLSDGTQGRAAVIVHAFALPTASLASPSYPPLNGPVVDFGQVADGTHVSATLAVRNAGTTPLNLTSVSQAGDVQGNFALDPRGCATPIAPGGRCDIDVTWDAEGCSADDPFLPCFDVTTVRVVSNADSSPDQYELYGMHTPSAVSNPIATGLQSSGPVYFGRVQLGTSSSQSFTLTGGYAPIPRISVSGTGFALANGCASLVGSVTATCSVTVTFTPTKLGFAIGTMRFLSSTGLSTATLSASAIAAQLSVSPAAVDFGSTPAFQSPPNQAITVKNISASDLVISTPAIANPAYKVVSSTCGSSLSAGKTCAFNVGLSPGDDHGVQNGSLSFSFGVDDGVQTIPLTSVVQSIDIAPTTASFGNAAVGQQVTRTFNVGIVQALQPGYTATIGSAMVSGADPQDFKIIATTCSKGASLSGAQTCSVTIQFSPSAVGARAATLSVSAITTLYGSVNFSTSTTAALTGSGIGLGSPGCAPGRRPDSIGIICPL